MSQPTTIRYEQIRNPPSATGGGSTFTFTQTIPLVVWTVNHNLNSKPSSVFVEDLMGNEIEGYMVEILNLNQIRFTFNPAFAGIVRITGV